MPDDITRSHPMFLILNISDFSLTFSRPYFEMKAQFNQLLEDQKKRVKSLEQQVGHAKMSYAEALHNLEQISDEIHRVSMY